MRCNQPFYPSCFVRADALPYNSEHLYTLYTSLTSLSLCVPLDLIPPGLPTPPPGSGLAAPPSPPISLSIILLGDDPLILDQCTLYVEPGALVVDAQGVSLVEFLSIDDTQVDVEVPGVYTVLYTAEDDQVGWTSGQCEAIEADRQH